ncbi:MAG TPA: 50S ribosomal protein L24 [Dehalococcoidia bacterium]|jgi:large subunit ribosomal protein L24|nr:50S ribosomal protein L24 [Dehalococcoidia bacterium]
MKIRKGDNVLIIKGKDRGKSGKVRRALPQDNRVVVEGLNMVKRHSRARGIMRQAGIIQREAPIDVSKVMLLCNKCNQPARVGFRLLAEGNRVRICRACKEVID